MPVRCGPGEKAETKVRALPIGIIANGVRKINYYTYLAKAGGMYVKEKCRAAEEYVFFHDVTQWAVQAMKEDVLHTIRVFSHLE